MTIANVAISNTFNEFRITTNDVIQEVNKLSDGTGTLVINTIAGSGALLTNLNASNVSSGTLDSGRLPTSGVSAGTYGSSSQIPVLVVDGYGRVTAASNTNVAGVSNFQYFSSNANFVVNTSDGSSYSASIGQDLGNTASVEFKDLTVSGNVTFTGNVVSVTANNLVVEDNIISLAKNNTTDVIDIGFLGHYSAGANVHTGLFRDATDSIWKFFQNYPIEPGANTNIDISNAEFEFASVQAQNITANGTFYGNGSGISSINAANLTSGTIPSERLPLSVITKSFLLMGA